ncbi:HAMP domain-containing histidine kinase [Lentzea alba]|uniref:sensor histidine kinase n=1 Tax=Lentzea alba TaxID=2714351 RepID=UPI0039BF869E
MTRRPGHPVRLKLTVSYAGLVLLTGLVLIGVAWMYLLRYVPNTDQGLLYLSPNQYLLSRIFARAAGVALAILLLFGLVGGWILSGRVLAPLDQIADAARKASQGSLSHRIRMEGAEDEFRELSDVFDTMLDQLESHVAEQQRFAANASHELRTPLSISKAIIDLARRDPAQDRGELLERLHEVNTRAIELTEALLLLSKTDRGTFTREPVDLSLVAEEAVETLLPFAERRRITLDVTGEPVQTSGSSALLLRMVTNLVQNAIAHNLPADGAVTVHLSSRQGVCVLEVENTGPQVPPELVPTLVEPFQRATERVRTEEHAGVGLGLAIVHSIVRAHDGRLDLEPRPAGGLLVRVRLPGQRKNSPSAAAASSGR